MVKAQVYEHMNKEVRSSRPRSIPFSTSCSANPTFYLSVVGEGVLRRNPEGTGLSTRGPHQLDSC